MSWLNLNHSLNSLKGQITNFASEVLSESPAQDVANKSLQGDSSATELEEKCRNQELEVSLGCITPILIFQLTADFKVMFLYFFIVILRQVIIRPVIILSNSFEVASLCKKYWRNVGIGARIT